jgi:hypothetical protein
MRRVTSIAVALLFTMGLPAYAPSQPQTRTPDTSLIELRITGPRLIRVGEKLSFKGVIANNSTQPIAFALRQGGWDCDGVFSWKITDAADRQLPPMERPPVTGMICCLTSGVSEDELIVLQPGQKYELPELSDPSDDFTFPGKGFYRVSLRFFYRPAMIDDGRKPEEIAKPGSKWELALRTGVLDLTSNAWNVYLTD